MGNKDIEDLKETVEELETWKRQKEQDDAVNRRLAKWALTLCMSATSAAMAGAYWLGQFIYGHWEPVKAAVLAFLSASKNQ